MNWFNDIESRYPVNEWKVNDVHLWPLIRIRMGYWLRKKNTPPQTVAKSPEPLEKNPAKKWYYRIISLLRFSYYYVSLSKKKYVFVSTISYREKVNEKYLNKFFDPIIETITYAKKDVAVWEYGTFFPEKKYSHRKYILPLEKLSLIFPYIQYRFKIAIPKKSTDVLPEFDQFIQEIKQHSSLKTYNSDFKKAFKQANNIHKISMLYELLLKKTKPKSVIILCYYSAEAYPIVLACKRLNVPCADFQHGPQGKVHPAYGSWLKIPEGGFNLLPNYFLTWNKSSAEAINLGFSNSKYHRGIYFGHPWIEYWKDKKEEITNNKAQKEILFSLQPIGELLTEEEIKMIKSTQECYTWLLRLHPRQIHQQQALEKVIEENELKAEINEATFKPLPSLLSQVDMHCTRSSGATIEAAVFGVPTLLLSPTGIAYYPEEISNESAYIPKSFDSEGFIEILKKLASKRSKNGVPQTLSHQNYQKTLDSIY